MMTCTRCQSSGFLNIEQVPKVVVAAGYEEVLNWIDERDFSRQGVSDLSMLGGVCLCYIKAPCAFCEGHHDVKVCDCCGDGSEWYGVPGEHYGADDPIGENGPYRYNGGLCECH